MEKQNYLLMKSLQGSQKDAEKLKLEIDYRKSIQRAINSNPDLQSSINSTPNPLVTHQSKELHYNFFKNDSPVENFIISPVCNSTFSTSQHSPAPIDHQYKFNQNSFLQETSDMLSNGNKSFLQSFHESSALINDIFKEKDKLEKDLAQSRNVIKSRRKPSDLK